MTTKDLLNQLIEFNSDELFYKEYYEAKKDEGNFKEYIDNLNVWEIKDRRLIVPEIKESFIPSKVDDSAFFDNNEKNNIAISKHNRYTPVFRHEHLFFELIYVLSGSCEQTIGQDTFTLKAGQFCLLAPETEHSIAVFDSSLVINILIRRTTFEDIFYNILKDANPLSVFFNNSLYAKSKSPYITMDTMKDANIRHQVLTMFLEFVEKDKYYESVLNSSLMILFSKILQKYEEHIFSPKETKHISSTFSDMMAYIYENYQHATLDDISKQFHFSAEYCSRIIKKHTGKSFTSIQQDIRFSKACFFLENTNNTIADISQLVGYNNVEHFNRLFKKRYGMTPSQYKKGNI